MKRTFTEDGGHRQRDRQKYEKSPNVIATRSIATARHPGKQTEIMAGNPRTAY